MRLISLSIVALLALSFVACEAEGPEIPADEFPPDPDLPPAVVDLPSPPPASAFEIKEFNEDNSLRVEGIVGNRDKYLDEEVEVRATIAEIRGDCDPRRARQRGETCLEPHLLITDHIDDDRRLLVVGYPNSFLRQARLQVGEEYLFKGLYEQMAHGFISTEDGLLVVSSVDDREVPE